MDILGNINSFVKDRGPGNRYASFDYCYNYFRQFYVSNNVKGIASRKYIQVSCLQLAFYLASWGMLRGSSFLLQKSAKHYEDLIMAISALDVKYWEIDADKYNDDNIKLLIKLYELIKNNLGDNDDEAASATLVTKIMLGVFANVPALDQYFCSGFGCSQYFSPGLLKRIGDFYVANQSAIDKHEIKTIDFTTGGETSFVYTKAKLIDMVGFMEGYEKSNRTGSK